MHEFRNRVKRFFFGGVPLPAVFGSEVRNNLLFYKKITGMIVYKASFQQNDRIPVFATCDATCDA
jgi:hypothetical protein